MEAAQQIGEVDAPLLEAAVQGAVEQCSTQVKHPQPYVDAQLKRVDGLCTRARAADVSASETSDAAPNFEKFLLTPELLLNIYLPGSNIRHHMSGSIFWRTGAGKGSLIEALRGGRAGLHPRTSYAESGHERRPPPAAHRLFGPRSVCLHPDGSLWVADAGHHRILGWKAAPGRDGTPADILPGQPGFGREGRNAKGPVTAAALNVPTGICAWRGGLAVADAWNHRVLIWDAAP